MRNILVTLAACGALSACSEYPQTTEQKNTAETSRLQAEADSKIGLPRINNFVEKRLATKLAELRDQPDLMTYAYVQGIDGRLTCFGKGIGFGIPYSTQITNPEKAGGYSPSYYTLPQAEPNGLYMPSSASATWYMLIDAKTGKAAPVYVEPNLTVSTVPLNGPAVAAACK